MSVLAGWPGGLEKANTMDTPSFSNTVRGGMVGSGAGAAWGRRGEGLAPPVPLSSAKGSEEARGGGAATGVRRGCAGPPEPTSPARGSCRRAAPVKRLLTN